MTVDVENLMQADFVLNKCGRPGAPQEGMSLLAIPKGFLLQVVFPAATTSPTQQITREIVGDIRGRCAASSSPAHPPRR